MQFYYTSYIQLQIQTCLYCRIKNYKYTNNLLQQNQNLHMHIESNYKTKFTNMLLLQKLKSTCTYSNTSECTCMYIILQNQTTNMILYQNQNTHNKMKLKNININMILQQNQNTQNINTYQIWFYSTVESYYQQLPITFEFYYRIKDKLDKKLPILLPNILFELNLKKLKNCQLDL